MSSVLPWLWVGLRLSTESRSPVSGLWASRGSWLLWSSRAGAGSPLCLSRCTQVGVLSLPGSQDDRDAWVGRDGQRHQSLFLCSEGCAQACPLSPLLGFMGRDQLAGACSALWTEVKGEGIFQGPEFPAPRPALSLTLALCVVSKWNPMQGRCRPQQTWQWRRTLYGDPRGLHGTARSQPVGSCCAVLGWRLQAGAPLVCVCLKTAGVAGSPHPQALDRPLLGTPGSCLAPSQCSLIILGHPQVPGQAVALRWGPLYVPHLLPSPHTWAWGLFPKPCCFQPRWTELTLWTLLSGS